MHKRILKLAIIFILIFSWIFGYPPLYENFWRAGIWQNPQIPPEVEKTQASAETKSPDGATFVLTNLTGAYTDVDDDPDSPDGLWLTASGNNTNIAVEASFPTPTGNPTVGAGLQEFRVLVRQFDEAQSGTPDARIELWENGGLVRAGSDTPVPDGGIVLSFTWNANEIGTANGSLVECNVVGTKAGGSSTTRNTVEVGAIEWNVDYVAASYSVSLNPISVDYGDMLMNATKASGTVTATNNGTATAKFLISGANATYSTYTWPLSTSISAADDYLHAYSTDLTEATGTGITEDYTTGWEDLLTGDSDLATSVIIDADQTFQLDMRTPASGSTGTSLGNQYSTDVTVTATAP